jgi:hypothetical protein
METTAPPGRTGHQYWRLLLLAALALISNAAFATADPSSVSFTLEGCRNDGTITLPNGSGQFICPDSAYTTGNLGKGWNELDLVPHRLTAHAGNSAPATQTYAVGVAADNCDGGGTTIYDCADGTHQNPGYDVLSAPILNTALSDASCTALSATAQQFEAPGVGGTAVSIYRILTITQAQNTTCVYDYYERLALGSHLYPGSSLHSDLLNQVLTTSGIGAKDVSIPVKEISPQELSKDMSATSNAMVSWEIQKSSTTANVSFGDVCSPDFSGSQPASITVTWTKDAATPSGSANVITHVYATNPSARTITVNVQDVIYAGTDQTTPLDTVTFPPVDVPANTTNYLVGTHTVSVPGSVGDFLNDVATATYTDKVTGVPIPGSTTAQASTQVTTGTTLDATADVSDSESMTGNGLTFSVPTPPDAGSFLNGYAGGQTTGPVDWQDLGVTDSGSITFNKTIYLSGPLVTSGVLSDTAKLDTNDQHLSSAPVNINISSTATVTLTVSKTIPSDYFTVSGATLALFFHIDGSGGYSNDVELDFAQGGSASNSVSLPGLTPQSFTVTETGGQYCDAGDGCTANTLLQAVSNPLVADLSTPANGDMTGRCSGTTAFTNTSLAKGIRVEVQKITNPTGLNPGDSGYSWSFTLAGPNSGNCVNPLTVVSNTSFALFQDKTLGDCLLTTGDYTVTETAQTGWFENSAVPNNGSNTLVCSFHVDAIFDDGKTFSCTFTNTRDGHVKVIKTFQGAPPTGTQSFDFTLRTGASAGVPGTIIDELFANAADGGVLAFSDLLTPGNHYQLCEVIQVGFGTNIKTVFTTAAFDADNSTVCFDFVATTDLQTFTIDNTPPPGNPGSARTIGYWKNWASCHQSGGKQAPVLDQTIVKATPPGIEYGSYYFTATSVPAASCSNAVSLLNKSTFTGTKMASDPLFNMTAQLIAAELNIVAGSASCAKVNTAIVNANQLLTKYNFNGITYSPKLSKADATTANTLATLLDNYNNNIPGTCP